MCAKGKCGFMIFHDKLLLILEWRREMTKQSALVHKLNYNGNCISKKDKIRAKPIMMQRWF